jgi:hypothetical protein
MSAIHRKLDKFKTEVYLMKTMQWFITKSYDVKIQIIIGDWCYSLLYYKELVANIAILKNQNQN